MVFGGAGFSAISFRKLDTRSSGSWGGGASLNLERFGGGASAIGAAARGGLSLVPPWLWMWSGGGVGAWRWQRCWQRYSDLCTHRYASRR